MEMAGLSPVLIYS